MKTLLVSFLMVLFISILPCRAQYHITYKVKGLETSMVTLSAIRGKIHTPIDSVYSNEGVIRFQSEKPVPVGVYRIDFGKNLFTDIIINHETIVIQNNMESLLDDLVVIESNENKTYYDYWRTSLYINDSIDLISEMGQSIYEANNKVMNSELDSMAKKAFRLQAYLEQFTQKLIDKSKGIYVQKLLLAYLEPSWEAYKMTSNAKKYKSRKEFLKEHFFDHVDFTDSTLLNSEVFYVLCTDYLTKFVDTQTDSNFNKAVDFILQKTSHGSPVYNYIVTLFINTYLDTEWETTFTHLVDNYLLKNHTAKVGWEQTMAQRATTIKKLRPGNKAPDFALDNSRGEPENLYSIKSKVILLLFWSSSCTHCEEVMPQIIEVYKKYHSRGLEIVAVSIETDKKAWQEAIIKNKMTWINVSDFKGMVSPVVESYNAYSTPIFFLLDADKTIIAHPQSPKEMQESLDRALEN